MNGVGGDIGFISYSELIKQYSPTGKTPDSKKYIQSISEGLFKSECPFVVRQLREAQIQYENKKCGTARIKLFFSGTIGAFASVTAKTANVFGTIVCLPFSCCKSLGRQTVYGMEDELSYLKKKNDDKWIDLGVALATVPVTWTAFFYPPVFKNQFLDIQDHYINRFDIDMEHSGELERKIILYEFNRNQLKFKQNTRYVEEMDNIKLEESLKEDWKSQIIVQNNEH